MGRERLLLAPAAGLLVGALLAWPAWIHVGVGTAMILGLAGAIVSGMIALCLVLVVIIGGPQHDRLRSTITSNGAAAWTLDGLLRGEPRPIFGGWAIDAATAAALVRVVQRPDVRRVVELGPGASTEILSPFCGPEGLDLVALEHDGGFLRAVADRLAAQPNRASIDLRLAPLVPCTLPGWRGRWYDPAATADLHDIDLLIVDGPPGSQAFSARYPAVPMLVSALRPGALVFVDDAPRREEARMVERWRTEYELDVVERGANHVVLRTPTRGS